MKIFRSKNSKRAYQPRFKKEEVLERVSSLEIYERYFRKEIETRYRYKNPLRDDKDPSFGFYINRRGTLMGHDFATQWVGDCFEFMQEMFNISFVDAIEMVANDFNLKMRTNPNILIARSPVRTVESIPERNLIQITTKAYTKRELQYWKQFGITAKILKFFNVYSVDKLFLNKQFLSRGKDWDPIFAYHFPKTDRLKIYRPLNKKYKWLGNNTEEDIQGFQQLTAQRKRIVLTSSMKDVMTLTAAGYEAFALNSESSLLPLSVQSYLLEYERVLIMYDNDEKGVLFARQIKEILGEKASLIFMPGEEKDPSDYVLAHSLTELKSYVKQRENMGNLSKVYDTRVVRLPIRIHHTGCDGADLQILTAT